MDKNYRVHYKKGDFEVEVESTDKDYVDDTLKRLIDQDIPPTSVTQGIEPLKGDAAPSSEPAEQDTAQTLDVSMLVNSIHESGDYPVIEEHIINKRKRLPRILMVLHFAHQYGIDYLTTADVEEITDQLRIKISKEHVSHTIKPNRKYFQTATSVKPGRKALYKLNRLGLQAYARCLKGESI